MSDIDNQSVPLDGSHVVGSTASNSTRIPGHQYGCTIQEKAISDKCPECGDERIIVTAFGETTHHEVDGKSCLRRQLATSEHRLIEAMSNCESMGARLVAVTSDRDSLRAIGDEVAGFLCGVKFGPPIGDAAKERARTLAVKIAGLLAKGNEK